MFHPSLMHEHRKKPHYRAKSPSPKVSPFSEPRLEPSLASQLLIRVVTLLFFHSGAIYHVHREHGALTSNLSTNTATADNTKHTSDPKTLSFTRNDPLMTSVPSRGWGARSPLMRFDPNFYSLGLLMVKPSYDLIESLCSTLCILAHSPSE